MSNEKKYIDGKQNNDEEKGSVCVCVFCTGIHIIKAKTVQ